MTPEERAARGIRARLFLEQAEVQQAFADIEQDITDEWKSAFSWWGQIKKWHELRGLTRLRDRLNNYAARAPR